MGVQYILLQKDREQRERERESDIHTWNTKEEITVARCRTREWCSKNSRIHSTCKKKQIMSNKLCWWRHLNLSFENTSMADNSSSWLRCFQWQTSTATEAIAIDYFAEDFDDTVEQEQAETCRNKQIYTWKPNDPCFDWKRPCFGGLTLKNRGHLGSRYLYICTYIYIYIYT